MLHAIAPFLHIYRPIVYLGPSTFPSKCSGIRTCLFPEYLPLSGFSYPPLCLRLKLPVSRQHCRRPNIPPLPRPLSPWGTSERYLLFPFSRADQRTYTGGAEGFRRLVPGPAKIGSYGWNRVIQGQRVACVPWWCVPRSSFFFFREMGPCPDLTTLLQRSTPEKDSGLLNE